MRVCGKKFSLVFLSNVLCLRFCQGAHLNFLLSFCLSQELLSRGDVLFRGNNTDFDQLSKIFDICGTPDETTWPRLLEYSFSLQSPMSRIIYFCAVGLQNFRLRMYQRFKPATRPRRLKEMFSAYPEDAIVKCILLVCRCPPLCLMFPRTY